MADLKRKAIIFARVSTKRQEKEGLSLEETQIPRCKGYAKDNNIEVVRIFKLSETAGDYKARKLFEEMIKYMSGHKDVENVISFRVDRITRNYRDAVVIDDLRILHDKFIHFVDDRLVMHKNSSANDLQNWDTKVYLAKQYLNRVREDGNITKYSKLERGELPWCAAYGYKHKVISENPKRKSVVTVEPAATVVRQIHIRYATGNYSCLSLAKSINEEFGTHLNKGQTQHILRDKFYIGIMTDKKTGKEYPHFYERLASDDVFEQNQDILNGHSTQRRRYGGVPSIYRGLITCALCGCTITPDPKKKKLANGNIKKYYYYHCSNGKHFHNTITNASESEINDAIMQVLKKFKIPAQRMVQLRQDLNEAHESKNSFYDAQRKELLQRRQQLSNWRRRTYDLMADGSITPHEYDENNARYTEELSEIQRKEERLDNADQQFYITAGYLLSVFEHAERLFEVAEIDEKKQIIGLLLSNLKLEGKKLTFNLKKPFDVLLNTSKGSLWLRSLSQVLTIYKQCISSDEHLPTP